MAVNMAYTADTALKNRQSIIKQIYFIQKFDDCYGRKENNILLKISDAHTDINLLKKREIL